MKRVKVSNCVDLASRMYRLGKINAEKDTTVLAVEFADYIEYANEIEWNCETISGCATILTDYKGDIITARYYND